MNKLIVSAVLLTSSAFAFAHGCPGEMKKIDAAMPTTKLNAQDTSKVKELRAKGEEQHKAGQHTESMKSLADAKKIMGIQ
jgi:hypothetical protein